MNEMQEILEDFLVESIELVEQLDQDLLELENSPENIDLLNKVFRVAHTIKGSSSFLGFDILTRLTHHMEDILNKARKSELIINSNIMDVILESTDCMKSLIDGIRENGNDTDSQIDIDPIVDKLNNILEDSHSNNINTKLEQESNQEKQSNNLDDQIEQLLKQRQEEDKARRAKNKQAKANKEQESSSIKNNQDNKANNAQNTTVNPTNTIKKPPIKPKDLKKTAKTKDISKNIEQTIRVDVSRLDSLMNLVGELVLGKNRLLKIYNDMEEGHEGDELLEDLNNVVSSVSLVTTDLQLAVMKTRMLPIGKVFNKFPRMVRDLAKELNKNIQLHIEGEETELDKSIVEEIGDPLIHLIRNSCDHGIETKEIRSQSSKPDMGTLSLKAYNEGNHIVIELRDDGAGINEDVLKQKAMEKGILSDAEAGNLTKRETMLLIFKPGFSAAKEVTNVSGRGVGMDVVKTNIENLNGIIDIDSILEEHTTIKLKIPLTLAIMQSLIVGVEGELYAIPLASVLETVKVDFSEIYKVEGKNVLKLRDEVLPLSTLSNLFDVKKIKKYDSSCYVVIIGVAENKLGLIVDYLIGQEEIVIKSLGSYLKDLPGIAGATIRGDGKITLILDTTAILQMALNSKNDTILNESLAKNDSKMPQGKPVILAVDDSATARNILKKTLKGIDCTLIEAGDGVEALSAINGLKDDLSLIITDIEMPNMDGFEFSKQVRANSRFKHVPIIATTTRMEKNYRLRALDCGINDYITKPYTGDYIINVIKRNLAIKV